MLISSRGQGYLSWMPSDTDCGPVNFIQLLPSFYDTALTTEWTVDLCAASKSAQIVPYWNGSPFPNFARELVNLLPVSSPDATTLQCYKDSIYIMKYSDQYYRVSRRCQRSGRRLLRQISTEYRSGCCTDSSAFTTYADRCAA